MNNWFLLSLISAFSLGLYDFSKKYSVNKNRVMPCLFLATAIGTLVLVGINLCCGTFICNFRCSTKELFFLILKPAIVTGSWVTGYFALHDLPLTIVAPIRASASIWVTIGGIMLFHNRPSPGQLCGMILCFLGYILFSCIGRTEGISWKHRGVWMVILATLLGAASALFDNFLLQTLTIPADTVQLHFCIHLVWLLGLVWLCQPAVKWLHEKEKFTWRWSIPAIGLLLLIADWAFFHAVACPDAQIGILSVLRRQSVIISFFCGAVTFKEKQLLPKFGILLLILAGVLILKFC